MTYELRSEWSFNRYVFDLNQGGNLIRFEAARKDAEEPRPWARISIEYDETDGVFVPAEWKMERQSISRDGIGSRRVENVRFESGINVPIEAEMFDPVVRESVARPAE